MRGITTTHSETPADLFWHRHTRELADQIAASGKNLTYVYITLGHGDHYYGVSTLKRRFPNARAVTPASVVDRIHKRLATDIQLFSTVGQIPR